MRRDGPIIPPLRLTQRRFGIAYATVFIVGLLIAALIYARSPAGAAISAEDWIGFALVGLLLVLIGNSLRSRPRAVRIFDRIFWVSDGRREIPVAFEQVRSISGQSWWHVPTEVVITLRDRVDGVGRRFRFRPEEHVGLIAFQEPVSVERLRALVFGSDR